MVSGGASPNSPKGDDASLPDPAQIETLPQLAAGLNMLRQGRSYAELDRAVGGRAKAPVLPPSTLSDMVNGKSVPSTDTMITFLTACGLTGSQQAPWLAAWERVETSHLRRPAGAVRVRAADARLLGVHASIQVDPRAEDLPAYVPRDVDADLRTAITAARDRGGFVLVKGSSSVGKTRGLFEAVKAVCPEWWLLHPADATTVQAFADAPAPRTVVWLDELQRYLTQPGGVPAGTMRALLAAKLLVVATLWPAEYSARTALRTPSEKDPYAEDRELLGLARIIEVPDAFSPAERKRAEDLAVDQRIRVALNTNDAGVTQVLAAGPELIRWWEHADVTDTRQCYGKAVITAALDARRVGATAPLTRDLLAAAAPAYLASAQQATAAPDWLDQAIGYATTRLHGATACLTPIAAGIGQVAGYNVADYLYQHASQSRRTIHLPDECWRAIVDYHHPEDTIRLARSAGLRGRYSEADELYPKAVAIDGSTSQWEDWACFLVDQERFQEAIDMWSERRQAGDIVAANMIAEGQSMRIAEHGRVDQALAMLRDQANAELDSPDERAGGQLAWLLGKYERIDELTERALAGSRSASHHLMEVYAKQHRTKDAISWLRDHPYLAGELAMVLVSHLGNHGYIDEAIALASPYAEDPGTVGWKARHRVAELVTAQGRTDDAIAMWREMADSGDWYAEHSLADLLADQGRSDEAAVMWRKMANNEYAAYRLADLLLDQNRPKEAMAIWHERCDPKKPRALYAAKLLVRQGYLDEAVAEMFRADVFINGGDLDELVGLLIEQGHLEAAIAVLRTRVRNWHGDARLVQVLREHGRTAEIEAEVAAGTAGAAAALRRIAVSKLM